MACNPLKIVPYLLIMGYFIIGISFIFVYMTTFSIFSLRAGLYIIFQHFLFHISEFIIGKIYRKYDINSNRILYWHSLPFFIAQLFIWIELLHNHTYLFSSILLGCFNSLKTIEIFKSVLYINLPYNYIRDCQYIFINISKCINDYHLITTHDSKLNNLQNMPNSFVFPYLLRFLPSLQLKFKSFLCFVNAIEIPNKHFNYTMYIIYFILFVGFYLIRLIAMVQASSSFNLTIETTKRKEHTLITKGIYSVFRHPSYFGWFYHILFSQLFLGNVYCTFFCTYVTWCFFKERIPYEEKILGSKDFFGEKYNTYKSKTYIGIPFI